MQGRSSNQTVVIWKLVAAEIWRVCVTLCVAVLALALQNQVVA